MDGDMRVVSEEIVKAGVRKVSFTSKPAMPSCVDGNGDDHAETTRFGVL